MRETLAAAAAMRRRPAVQVMPLSCANDALQMLRAGGVRGAFVLQVDDAT